MERGPNREPGRNGEPSSNGAPRIATSASIRPASVCTGARRNDGMPTNGMSSRPVSIPSVPMRHPDYSGAVPSLSSRRRRRAVIDDHPAGALAAAHRVERGLYIVQPDAPLDQVLDRQPPGEVQGGVAWKVQRPD